MAKIIFWNTFVRGNLIYLLRPPGPHILNSWLKHNGHDCKVLDFCSYLTTDQLVTLTEKFITKDTVAIGVSTTFWKKLDVILSDQQTGSYKKLPNEPDWVISAREILEAKYPNLKWIMGGSGPDYNFKFDWIHFKGKAEDSLLKFLDQSTDKKFEIANARYHYYDDLGITKNETLSIELARGCQFVCKFCRYDMIGKKTDTYIRNMDLVYEDLLDNYYKFGTTRYNIVDDTVNESDQKIEKFAEIVNKLPFKLEWVGYNRLDLIGAKRHTIDLLKQTGLRGALFGIESFHPDASKCIGKGWIGKHGKDFLLELREKWDNKIHFSLSLIVGLPYEPLESVQTTHQYCVDNKIDYWQFVGLQLDKSRPISIFEREYAQYNIKFTHPLKPTYWEHEICNFSDAQNLALTLNHDPKRTTTIKPIMWDWAAYTPFGYTFDDLNNITQKSFYENNNLKLLGTKFLDDYK
jgi:hypothetical protein